MLAFAKPSDLGGETSPVRVKIRAKWNMPEAKEKEEIKTYIWKVQDDAPFEYETIAGETVCKYKNPSDHALTVNAGKPKKTLIPTVRLSESQAKALLKRMKEHEKVCYFADERKYKVVNCADYIDLCTIDEYQKKMFSGGGEITP